MFSDAVWGWIYVIHGVCGIGLIFLVIAHVYFAIRPEKRWMTWSMINGWIDSRPLPLPGEPRPRTLGGGGGGSGAVVSDKVRGEGP